MPVCVGAMDVFGIDAGMPEEHFYDGRPAVHCGDVEPTVTSWSKSRHWNIRRPIEWRFFGSEPRDDTPVTLE